MEDQVMKILLYGLLTGICFGFCLQRGQVLRYEKQIGPLRLIDMTIVKFMLSSILVAMVGVYALHDLGLAKLSIKTTVLGGNILGGLIFGLGWGLFGYCPGTAVGAVGEGRWGAFWGILGMLTGAALFAEAYPFLKQTVLTWGDFGKLTLTQMLGVNHWAIIPLMVLGSLGLFYWFEKTGL
jgi:uncharacterized membrane protein YedE/YeeE